MIRLILAVALTLIGACSPSAAPSDAAQARPQAAAEGPALRVGMPRAKLVRALGSPAETQRIEDGVLLRFEREGEEGLVVALGLDRRVAAWMTDTEFAAFVEGQAAAQAEAVAQGLAALGYGWGGASAGYAGSGYASSGYAGDGSLAGLGYDSNVDYGDSTNPDSWAFDQYEYDSQGWSGGAHENPSSSYYDAGSYDTYTPSFDSIGY